MDKDKPKVVTFKCRFKRFSTYLKNGKRIRFADGIYRTGDADAIEFLRKNYRPPMMAEIEEPEAVASVATVDPVATLPKTPPFFPGQSAVLAHLAVPPAVEDAPPPEGKKSGSKK